MIEGMLCIMSVYGLSIVLIHNLYRRLHVEDVDKPSNPHYVLVSQCNQNQIEWVIRSIRFFHWLDGNNVKISVIDQDSDDETVPILLRMQRGGMLTLYNDAELVPEQFALQHQASILIYLNGEEDWRSASLMR